MMYLFVYGLMFVFAFWYSYVGMSNLLDLWGLCRLCMQGIVPKECEINIFNLPFSGLRKP